MREIGHPNNEGKAYEIIRMIENAGMIPQSTDYFVKNYPEEMHWEQVHDYHRWEPENA